MKLYNVELNEKLSVLVEVINPQIRGSQLEILTAGNICF